MNNRNPRKVCLYKLNLKIKSFKASIFIVLRENKMTENLRKICICQVYNLKSDAEELLDFFHADRSPQVKKATKKYVDQFLDPSVYYKKRVGTVESELYVVLKFSPSLYRDRARELLSTAEMSKATKSFVQQRKTRAEKFFKRDLKSSLFFALSVTGQLDSGFSPEFIPRVLRTKIIKSNLDFLLKKVYRLSIHGYVCSTLQYDASKFKFVGGILRARLPVPKLISSKLGKPDLEGIALSFEDSPIGLEEVEMEKENGQLILTLKIARKVNSFKDAFPKVLSETRKIAELLVESAV